MYKILFAAILATFLMQSYAYADNVASKSVSILQSRGLISWVYLITHDEVSGRCWTNANSISSKIRLIFERNGVGVIQEPPWFSGVFRPTVRLHVLGARQTGSCIGTARFLVETNETSSYSQGPDETNFVVGTAPRIFEEMMLMYNPESLNTDINDFFEGAASKLVADIIKYRREPSIQEVRQELQRFTIEPVSRREMERRIKESLNR